MIPLLMRPDSHRALDRAGGAHPVDRPHVEAVAAFGGLPGVAHAERGAEDGGLDVVHGDRVPGQHRLHVAVPDEPLEVGPGPRVHQRRPDDPHQIAAAALLLAHPRRQLLVVDRPLPAHLGGHEAELVGPVRAAQETLGVDHDALGAVLRLAHGDQVAPLEPARLDGLQHARRASPPRSPSAAGSAPATGRRPGRRSAGWRWRRSPPAGRRRPAAARSAPRARRQRAGRLKSGDVSGRHGACIRGRKLGGAQGGFKHARPCLDG